MYRIRLVLTLTVAGIALAMFTAGVQAAAPFTARTDAAPARARLDQAPLFTRIQTVTLVTAPDPNATTLTTIWENSWVDADFTFGFPLPSDFSNVTVEGGDFHILTNEPPETTSFGEVYTNKVNLTPTVGLPLYLSYYTDSRAVREGNQFRIFIRASSPLTSAYRTAVLFEESFYEFVNFLDNVPTDTLPLGVPLIQTGGVAWGPITVKPTDKFDKYVALGDARLPIDLIIQSARVITTVNKQSVQVTATILNSGTVATGNYFFVELYDRPDKNPNDFPDGPNDHIGGWCLDAQCSPPRWGNVPYHNYPYDPAKALQPGQTWHVTITYPFEVGGLRDLYLQVDTMGGSNGFILEPGTTPFGEHNNIVFLGTYQAVGKLYLPITLKNK